VGTSSEFVTCVSENFNSDTFPNDLMDVKIQETRGITVAGHRLGITLKIW